MDLTSVTYRVLAAMILLKSIVENCSVQLKYVATCATIFLHDHLCDIDI